MESGSPPPVKIFILVTTFPTPEFQVHTIAYGNEMDCELYYSDTYKIGMMISISFTCDIGAEIS